MVAPARLAAGMIHALQMHMKTLVVIVNYRTPGLTVDCLRSLAPEIDAETQVVVTDNASGDESVEVISRAIAESGWSSWCTLKPLPRNGGFAYGNNLGMSGLGLSGQSEAQSGQCAEDSGQNDARMRPALNSTDCPLPSADYIFLLNPDTTVFPGVIRELVAFMDANPRCGIAGSRAENQNGTVRKSAFRFHSISGEFERQAELGIVSKLLRRSASGCRFPIAPPESIG